MKQFHRHHIVDICQSDIIFQLEITKTSDNKATFLHVLAETVFVKFPEVLAVGEELTSVPEAAKGNLHVFCH